MLVPAWGKRCYMSLTVDSIAVRSPLCGLALQAWGLLPAGAWGRPITVLPEPRV